MEPQCDLCGLTLQRYLIQCQCCQKYFCNQTHGDATESDAVKHMIVAKHAQFLFKSSQVLADCDPKCIICQKHNAARLSYFLVDGATIVICYTSCILEYNDELAMQPVRFIGQDGAFSKTLVPVPSSEVITLKIEEDTIPDTIGENDEATMIRRSTKRTIRTRLELEQMSNDAIAQLLKDMDEQAEHLPKIPIRFNYRVRDIFCVNGEPYAKRYFEHEIEMGQVIYSEETKQLSSDDEVLSSKIQKKMDRIVEYDQLFKQLISFNYKYEMTANIQKALEIDINIMYIRQKTEKSYFDFLVMGWDRYNTISGQKVNIGDPVSAQLISSDGQITDYECQILQVQERLILRCSMSKIPKDVKLFSTQVNIEVGNIRLTDVAQDSVLKNDASFLDHEVWRFADGQRFKVQASSSMETVRRQNQAVKFIAEQCNSNALYQILLGKIDGNIVEEVKKRSQRLLHIRDCDDIVQKVKQQSIQNVGTWLNEAQEASLRKTLTNCLTMIQGCPGGGKTYTAACILQALFELHSKETKPAKILCCTGSNIAADNIAVFCKKLKLNALRVYARTLEGDQFDYQKLEEVSELNMYNIIKRRLLEGDYVRAKILTQFQNTALSVYQLGDELYTNWLHKQSEKLEDGPDYLMNKVEQHEISIHDIIISTCSTSGSARLLELNVNAVVLDESSQAIEPEQMVAIQHTDRHLVIIGDHNQLGPSISHPCLIGAKLARSLYTRLLSLGLLPISLNVQYRMHTGLLEFPNAKFYAGNIRSGITDAQRMLQLQNPAFQHPYGLSHLIKPGFPSLFLQINGREQLITDSKSFQNQQEVDIICQLIRVVLIEYKVQAKDIGVITPYSAQQLLFYKDTTKISSEIEVNSIDGFQGREKEVIFYSAVRSNTQTIGFLHDKRRLNVTMTRARRLFVIVANGRVLQQDLMYRELWNYYLSKNAIYEGTTLKDLTKVEKKKNEKGEKNQKDEKE